MKAGVGYSNVEDSYRAGLAVAGQAMEQGSFDKTDILFAFCNGVMDHDKFYRGLRTVVGESTPIIGGSAIGIVTNDVIAYEGFPAGALAIQCENMQCPMATSADLHHNEKAAGRKFAETIIASGDASNILLFYDSIKKPATAATPPVMNASGPIIAGIEEVFGNDVSIFGAGLMGDYQFNSIRQFCIDRVADQSIVGVAPHGDFKMYHSIMHGLTPLDGLYHTITRMKGDCIFEIDGKSVTKMIDEIYGHREWRNQRPVDLIAIGVNLGRRYGIPKDTNHVNRIITGVLSDGSGVALFEPDLEEGTEIQFMLRDTGEILDSTRRNSMNVLDEIAQDGRRPVFGLYFDCAGRTAKMSNTTVEEASEVQKSFNRADIPLFGFYTGVEIAPMVGKNRGLDLTGVLIIIAE